MQRGIWALEGARKPAGYKGGHYPKSWFESHLPEHPRMFPG